MTKRIQDKYIGYVFKNIIFLNIIVYLPFDLGIQICGE